MSTIAVGSTVNIQFMFSYNDVLVDPDTLTGEIYLYDDIVGGYVAPPDDTFTPTMISTGIYETNWTPTVEGRYLVSLLGEFNDATPDIHHQKYFLIGDVELLKSIDSTYCITMLGVLTPTYADPEYVLQFYPDGDLTEITEIIHRKSLELENKVGCTNINPLTSLQHDFVVAATLCELSRIYGLTGGGLTGFSGADSFKLGDLEVSKGTNVGTGKNNYDVGNADTWCELAAALKNQLNSTTGKLRPVVPGASFETPIPIRSLRSSDF